MLLMRLWKDFSKGIDGLHKNLKQQALIENIKNSTIEAIEASQGKGRYSSLKIDYQFPIKYTETNNKKIFSILKKAYVVPEGFSVMSEKTDKLTLGAGGGFWTGFNDFLEFRVKKHEGNIFLIKEQTTKPNMYLSEETRKAFEIDFSRDVQQIMESLYYHYSSKLEGKVLLNIDEKKLPEFFDRYIELNSEGEDRRLVKVNKPKSAEIECDNDDDLIIITIKILVKQGKFSLVDSVKTLNGRAILETSQEEYQKMVEEDVEKICQELSSKKRTAVNFCSKCGKKAGLKENFCKNCGNKH